MNYMVEEPKTPEESKAEKLSATALKGAETKREKAEAGATAPSKASKKGSILKNLLGEEVPEEDYFYKGIVPSGFKGTCGDPVAREDLIEVFHKVFKPSDNILFYKQADKEVYIIIIPIKYSTSIGEFNNSLDGDFQKHAISFLNEGSVNLDTLRIKLERITKFIKYSDR